MIDVESEITEAIKSIGGERVSDYLSKSPAFENADYIFHNYKVVAELKCLDEDKMHDSQFIDKASKIYRDESTTPIRVFGTRTLSTDGFSSEFTRKIRNLYRKPIKNRVLKANKQIKNTRKELNVEDYKGVVIVVNNNNSALDPWHIHEILESLMNQDCYSAINGAIFFNVNQKVVLPQDSREYTAWVTLDRDNRQKIDLEFQAAFRNCWFKHFSKLIGESNYTISKGSQSDLASLENKDV